MFDERQFAFLDGQRHLGCDSLVNRTRKWHEVRIGRRIGRWQKLGQVFVVVKRVITTELVVKVAEVLACRLAEC